MSRVLTDAAVKRLTPKPKLYRVAVGDGSGLLIEVTPPGGKHWRLRFLNPRGKPSMLALGSFPVVDLDEARSKARAQRDLIEGGRDPVVEKQREKLRARVAANATFGTVAAEFVASRGSRWGERHAKAQARRIEVDLADLARIPIAEIDAPMVLAALRKIEQRGALEIAAKARRLASETFRFGIATGRCERDPAAPLKGVIQSREIINRAALPFAEVPRLFEAIARTPREPVTARALVFLFATAARSGEVRLAPWREIDLERKRWTIPAARMKMKRDHVVPLSSLALAALGDARGPNDLVFPGFSAHGALSENALNQLVTRAGFYKRQTAHGARATFSSWAHEVAKAEPDVIEACLAHTIAGVRGKYNRALYLKQRTALLQLWADQLVGCGIEAVLVPS